MSAHERKWVRWGAVGLALVLAGCVSPRRGTLHADAADVEGEEDGPAPTLGHDTSPAGLGGASGTEPDSGSAVNPDAASSPKPDAGLKLETGSAPPPDAPMVDPGCEAGWHRCMGGACFNDVDPNHCGASCQRCPVPAHGDAVCRNGACEVTCNGGYHACNKVCYADEDPAHCGAGCVDCPDPPGGQASCNAGSCNVSCGSGNHACSKACYPDTDPTHCGAGCASCPVPAHSQAFCQGSCGFACDGGYHPCGNSCYGDSDTSHCGAGCNACPAITNGTAVCRNGQCDANCNGGALACTGLPPVCVNPSWGFESNTTEGWVVHVQSGVTNAALSVSASSTRAHTGSRSLSAPVSTNFAQNRYVVSLDLTFCSSGGLDIGGKTISMWVYFEGPALNANCLSDPYVYTTDGTSYDPNSFGGQSATIPVANQWFQVRSVMPTSESHIVRTLQFFTNLNIDGWTGTVYLDDITVK